MLLRIAAVASAAAAGARAQQSSGQGSWPPECQDVNKPDGVAVVLGGALGDAAQQITYSAADGPNVEAHLIDDPGGRRTETVIDCRWLLRCSDSNLVPQVTFTSFATENNHDYVRAWDGTPIEDPSVHRIADLHGGRLPDPIVGFGDALTLQFVSDGTDDRWSTGDHFTAEARCVAGNPDAVHPSDTHRCTMEYHPRQDVSPASERVAGLPDRCNQDCTMSFEADCASRNEGGHLASIHSPEDQEHFESVAQAFSARSIWIGLNDIDSESRCAGEDFVWTDGTPLDYENWSPGEPNNFQGFMRPAGCQPSDRDSKEDCVEAWRQGQSWSDAPCRYGGPSGYMCMYGCDPMPPPPGPALPCTSTAGLLARITGLTETCCPDGSCSSALPRFCDMSCSLAVLAFAADCQAFFGPVQLAQIIDPVLAICDLTAGDADPTEIGGDQLDHFVIGQLIGCTNLAHGRPATQSSTGYGGEAWKAVDGNGLDGSWGSASCSHTGEDEVPPPPPPPPPPGPRDRPCSEGRQRGESTSEFRDRCLRGPPPPPPPIGTWWQVDLGSVQEIRAVQLVNRADCCQDRLIGARIVVSQTTDYEADTRRLPQDSRPPSTISCGSVDEAESPIDEQEVIIKACEPGTSGRYVTVVGPNRVYPSPDNLYLSLCEVAVYGGCPPLPAAALGNTLSATEAAAAESLGAHCQITMGTDSLSFADAERACNLQGGHLASIHSEEEAEYARALVSNSPWARQGEAWIGLNDRKVECSCHSDCFVWTDGTPNDFLTQWRQTEPDDARPPGQCAPEPGAPPPPCVDDDAGMQELTFDMTCSSAAPWGVHLSDSCPIQETDCGSLGHPFAPIVCANYIDDPQCTCTCPPPSEDCTALKDVLAAPDVGWVDTICELEKPYLCRVCERPTKHGADDGDGH